MRKRFSKPIPVIICTALIAAVLSSCLESRIEPEKLDLSGVELTVWDTFQPKFAGSSDYSSEAERVVQEFTVETGVKVNYRCAERREALSVLRGDDPSSRPHLMFSSEWPVTSEKLPDLSDSVDAASYVDPAAMYWSQDGSLFGIPAYIQWIGTAVRKPSGSSGGADDAVGTPDAAARLRTGYWVDSPGFFRAALDCPESLWDEQSLLTFTKWVKDTYGEFSEDPLMSWQNGVVDALYPVTPYLYKWLRATAGDGAVVAAVPPSTPSGGQVFYYTVPAYLVLADESAEKVAAIELGKRLAANLGRWATRTLGCVPALVSDMTIFNLESGFDYEERRLIWESVSSVVRRAPDVSDFAQSGALNGALTAPVTEYLSGEATFQELEQSIREACLRNTKP